MKTIEDIKAKCTIIPHDNNPEKEHWIWSGARRFKNSGTPTCWAPNYTKDPSGKTYTVHNVKRAIQHILTKLPIPPHKEAHCACTVPDCVSPDCTAMVSRKKAGKIIERNGRMRGDIRKVIAAHRSWIGRRKVTSEMYLKIMSDPRPATTMAPELGVHHTTITRVRRGEHKGITATPFAGLLR